MSKFEGMSLLRKDEGPTEEEKARAAALQAYLKKYTGEGGDEGRKKKKKKAKAAKSTGSQALVIKDEDISGCKPAELQQEGNEEDELEGAVTVNEKEFEFQQRREERARQYFGRDEDGSGWVAVEPAGKPSVSGRDAQGGIGRRRHDSDSDASPPRRQRHDSGSDASPPRRQRHDSGSDASPPRRQRHDSGSDASPPRRQRHDSGSDASPPRRQRHDSGSDASPPRRQRHDWGSDASPPRKPVAAGGAGPRPASPRMADGTRAGMILAKDLQEEMRARRAEEQRRMETLDPRALGRGAEVQTVYRNKEGKLVDKEEFDRERRKKRSRDETSFRPDWGGGLAQLQAAEARRKQQEELKAMPFAVTKDNEVLDWEARRKTRWGDPAAAKGVGSGRAAPAVTLGVLTPEMRERLLKQGFRIPQEVPAHSWLKRGIGPPPNRFDIRPGRHWDGRDRSNGFEAKYFKITNERRWKEQREQKHDMSDW